MEKQLIDTLAPRVRHKAHRLRYIGSLKFCPSEPGKICLLRPIKFSMNFIWGFKLP